MAQQQQDQLSYKQGYNLLAWAAWIHAAPVEVFFRKPWTVGNRYFGLQAALALFYFPMFGALLVSPFTPPGEFAWHMNFGVASFFALLFHRVVRLFRPRDYPYIHSQSKGVSCVGGYGAEVAITLVAGLVVQAFSKPLGVYLMWAAAAMFFNQGIIEMRDKAAVRDALDAQWEQQLRADQLRRENPP